MSHRAMQVVLVLLGLILQGTGGLDIVMGPEILPGNPQVDPNVDSNYRFFAGIWFTLGFVLLRAVRQVPHADGTLRVVYYAVMAGGLARLVSIAAAGVPHPMLIGFLVIELTVPPLMLWWHKRSTPLPGQA